MNRMLGDSPRPKRISVNQPALLITSDQTELSVVLRDISADGFRLEAAETFYAGENIEVGEQVIIRIARREDVLALIVWAVGRELGGVFIAPASVPS